MHAFLSMYLHIHAVILKLSETLVGISDFTQAPNISAAYSLKIMSYNVSNKTKDQTTTNYTSSGGS